MSKYNLESSFDSSWRHSIQHSNLIGVIHDVSNKWTRNALHSTVLKCLESYPKLPSFLVLNKIDLLKSKRVLLDVVKILTNNTLKHGKFYGKKDKPNKNVKGESNNEKKDESVADLLNSEEIEKNKSHVGWSHFSEIFMVSSTTGNGVDRVMNFILSHSKPGAWENFPSKFSDQSPETLIVQSVRARLLDYLPQEIPYLLNCEMDLYSNEHGKIYTCVQVSCPSSRIEKLVVGEGNGKLKQITERVSSDLVEMFGVPISITIMTKVQNKEKN